jgi:hypothetical protein
MDLKKKRIYIVIYAKEVGGAELRFFGLWKHAIKQQDKRFEFNIILSTELLEVLLERETIEDKTVIKNSKNIVPYNFDHGFKKNKDELEDYVKLN